MGGFIKVIVYGHLTRNPEQRVTTAGMDITKFAIAVSRSYKGTDGNQKEEVTFLDVDAFGKPAELIIQHFVKGKPILLEGRLRQDHWETQTGERRSKHVIVLESFHFINSTPRDSIEGEPIEAPSQSNSNVNPSIPFKQNAFNTASLQKQSIRTTPLSQDFAIDDIPF